MIGYASTYQTVSCGLRLFCAGSAFENCNDHILKPEHNYTALQYAELFQQGNEIGLKFFYLHFHPALSLFAFRWVKNRQIAEEIAADAFIKIWKFHWKLERYTAIRAYLYKIVLRDCRRSLKTGQRHSEMQKTVVFDGSNELIIDQIIKAEVYRDLYSAIKELSPGSQQVIRMHFLEGKTDKEIAAELKLSQSTIRTQKARGLEILRKKMFRLLLITVCFLAEIFLPLL